MHDTEKSNYINLILLFNILDVSFRYPWSLFFPSDDRFGCRSIKVREVMVSTSEFTHIILQQGTEPNMRAGFSLQRTLGSGVK